MTEGRRLHYSKKRNKRTVDTNLIKKIGQQQARSIVAGKFVLHVQMVKNKHVFIPWSLDKVANEAAVLRADRRRGEASLNDGGFFFNQM